MKSALPAAGAALCALLAASPPTHVQAQDIDKLVGAYRQVLAENMPGATYQARPYLAFITKDGDTKVYEGALGDLTIFRMEVDAQDRIRAIVLDTTTQKDICQKIRPIIQSKFGEHASTKRPSLSGEMREATYKISGTRIRGFGSQQWKYMTQAHEVSFDCIEQVLDPSGRPAPKGLPYTHLVVDSKK